MGFFSKTFSKLKEGLTKTRDNIVSQIKTIIATKTSIDDDFLEQLEEILLSADVGTTTTESIISGLRVRAKEDGFQTTDEVMKMLRTEILNLLPTKNINENGNTPIPFVIMIVGVNGVGKTTTIGKLAHNFTTDGKKVLIAAADTFRAAANEQLTIWAQRANVEIVQQERGADPGAVVFDALSSAIARKMDVLLIDTAGRLHTNTNLMEELKKIRRVLQKIIPDTPNEVFLVIDASTGQNAIQQAKIFTSEVDVSGLIITKLDGTAKGGVVLAIQQTLKTPVHYIGVGEGIDDLQKFDSTQFVNALLGTENLE